MLILVRLSTQVYDILDLFRIYIHHQWYINLVWCTDFNFGNIYRNINEVEISSSKELIFLDW